MGSGGDREEEKAKGGWESFAEDAEGGVLAPSPELEEALREAAEAVEARQARRKGGDAPREDPRKLAEEKVALEAEVADLKDRLVRLQADFENHRKRSLKERQDAARYGHENLVKDLLATVDNLDRAIEHAERSGGGDFQSMLQGVELVRRELLAALASHGVRVIEAEGTFDPNVHEAMAQVEDSERPAGGIVEVLQKGYVLHDRLLRPARVVVAKAAAAPGEEES